MISQSVRESIAIGHLAAGSHFVVDGTRVDWSIPQHVLELPKPLQFEAVWSAEWVALGCPVLTATHTFAAALMCTKPPRDEVLAPWPTFMVKIPNGIIDQADCIEVRKFSATTWSIQYADQSDGQTYTCLGNIHEAALSELPDFVADHPLKWETPKSGMFSGLEAVPKPNAQSGRIFNMLARFICGACIACVDAPPRRSGKTVSATTRRLPGEPPRVTEYVVGPPVEVNIDCREVIRNYVSGVTKHARSVQWPVRGHFTHQPCGPGSALRRKQWRPPHWSGDPNAPKLVRSHKLTGR